MEENGQKRMQNLKKKNGKKVPNFKRNVGKSAKTRENMHKILEENA